MAQITLNSSGVASNGTLALQSNGTTTAVTIDASQRLIVGATSAAEGSPVEIVSNTGGGGIRIRGRVSDGSGAVTFGPNATSTEYARVGSDSNSALLFGTGSGGAERARIDSSGNLLVGTTNNVFGSRLCVQGTAGSSTPDVLVGIPLNASSNTQLQIYRSAAVSGYVGLETVNAAVGGTSLVVNAINGGSLLVGTTSSDAGGVNVRTHISGSQFGLGISVPASGSQQNIRFVNGTTAVGSVTTTSSNTAYNTSSDYRLKNTIAPMTGALAKVALLKPVTYKWNIDGANGEGFIAHELAEVCPQAVNGEKDALNEDGSIKSQGIDVSFLVATLTAAIQEQQALITQLQADVAALKA
jgi:hypothetical protein